MPCDYSKYPKDWKLRRKIVQQRANDRCEICGVKNYSKRFNGEKYIKIILTTAHWYNHEDHTP